jgi:hypothetical protein
VGQRTRIKKDAGTDERIMLNKILKEWCVVVQTGCSLPSGRLISTCGKFLDQLGNCQLLKNDTAS